MVEWLEHNYCGNTSSPTICTIMHADFWQRYIFSLAHSLSTNPISSQILIFVTLHLTTQIK